MSQVIVLFGSNIDPLANFRSVLKELAKCTAIYVRKVSTIYVSPMVNAAGDIDVCREPFHNAALLIETSLERSALRTRLRTIEENLGRQRSDDKFADRPVDLDILGYLAGSIMAWEDATNRTHAFAAVPAAEVAPNWRIAPGGATLAALALDFEKDILIRRTV